MNVANNSEIGTIHNETYAVYVNHTYLVHMACAHDYCSLKIGTQIYFAVWESSFIFNWVIFNSFNF